jgi:hypothetical protein
MSKAQIELPKQLYFAGEEINGTVRFSIDKPVSQRSATLCLVGKERTEVSYTTTAYVGKSAQSQNRTAVEESEFLRQEAPLPLPVGGKGKFAPGNYSIPFRFVLPQSLPMSYKSKHVKITYVITTKIDVPLGFDIKDSSEFDVMPVPKSILSSPVNVCSDSWNSPQSAGISLSLDRCEYKSGEAVTGSCSFKNPSSKNLRKIDVNLRWFETATAQGHKAATEVMKTAAKVPVGGRQAKGENKFSIQIPQEAPLTFDSALSNLRCMLGVSLDIAFGSDVAASEAIKIVGRVGDESVVPSYAAVETAQRRGVYCHSCGAYLEAPDANYCPFCGAKVTR